MKKNERTLPLEEDKKTSIGNRNYYFFRNFVLRKPPWQYLVQCNHARSLSHSHQNTQQHPDT